MSHFWRRLCAVIPVACLLILASCSDGPTDPDVRDSALNAPQPTNDSVTMPCGGSSTEPDIECSGGGGDEDCHYTTCDPTDGTGDGGGGGGGGSGSNSAGAGPDEATDCHLADSGNCDIREATPGETTQALSLANMIQDAGICGGVKTMAIEMINNGLEVWTNKVTQDGYTILGDYARKFVDDTGTNTVPVMHLWLEGGMNSWTIAHEALHGMGYSHEDQITGPDGITRPMDDAARVCSGT